MNAQKVFIVPLLVAIIVILIVGGGVYIYSKNASNVKVNENDNSSLVTPSTTETEVITPPTTSVSTNNNLIDTSQWKTFIDEKYGFELQYPSIFGNVIINSEKYARKLDCSSNSVYNLVETYKNIQGLSVKISCPKDFEKIALTYAHDYNSGSGTYEVIIDNQGKKSYFFDYVSGVGYTNQELYIPFTNNTYILIGHSQKNGWTEDYPPLTLKQARGIVSTFKILDNANPFYNPQKYIEPITENEIKNRSYEKPTINVNNNLYFTTYQNGLYQSPKIVCNGANTCPEGEYTFSEITHIGLNSQKTSAAVVIQSAYAPTLNDFHQKLSDFGAQAIDIYLLRKDGTYISSTKPFSLGGGFQINLGLNSLKVTSVNISDNNIITVNATAKKNDGSGNFSNVNLSYQFRLENDVLVLQ